jgi:uncharacterized protein with NRDE domain
MHPRYRLVLGANRDEYYSRPTEPLAFWGDEPHVLAGRDLEGNGTWLGVARRGRFSAITNFRDSIPQIEAAPSRGLLVGNFLKGSQSPEGYLGRIQARGHRYNGFNLIAGDMTGLYYYSNRAPGVRNIKPGIHGLSNHFLDTSWPKISKGKAGLQAVLSGENEIDPDAIFSILADRSFPPDQQLPATGVGLFRERMLSPLFISSPDYGTRSSSVLLIEQTGRVIFLERTFNPKPEARPGAQIEQETRSFSFTITT